MTIVDDEALTQAIARGDQASFEAFIHRYHGPLLNFIERMLQDPGKAEDFVQETFIKFIRQLKEKGIPDNSKAWLFKVAANMCRDHWRSASYKKEKHVLEYIPEKESPNDSVVDIYEKQETRKEILAVLNQLPERQREIVILRFYHDMKLKEIAEILDCPIGTIKSRLFHSMAFLKETLSGQEGAESHERKFK